MTARRTKKKTMKTEKNSDDSRKTNKRFYVSETNFKEKQRCILIESFYIIKNSEF